MGLTRIGGHLIGQKPSHQLSGLRYEKLAEYAAYGLNGQCFMQKYRRYLPDSEALRRELEIRLREAVADGAGLVAQGVNLNQFRGLETGAFAKL